MKFADYEPPDTPPDVEGLARNAMELSGNPEPHRTILVHLNVEVPAGDRRSVETIASVIHGALMVGSDHPSVRDLNVEVVLAEETGEELAPTGHVVGALYRSSFWGGNYRVIRGIGQNAVEHECVTPGHGGGQGVGERWSSNYPLDPLDTRLEPVAWVGRVSGGPSLGFPSVESAEQYVAVRLAKDDPVGVERGDYFIDAQETP